MSYVVNTYSDHLFYACCTPMPNIHAIAKHLISNCYTLVLCNQHTLVVHIQHLYCTCPVRSGVSFMHAYISLVYGFTNVVQNTSTLCFAPSMPSHSPVCLTADSQPSATILNKILACSYYVHLSCKWLRHLTSTSVSLMESRFSASSSHVACTSSWPVTNTSTSPGGCIPA
jgi:hypothetical protein